VEKFSGRGALFGAKAARTYNRCSTKIDCEFAPVVLSYEPDPFSGITLD